MSDQPKKEETYSEEEAERRFQAVLRAALKTHPKHLKDVPRQRPDLKRKPGKEAAKPSAV